MRDVVVVQCPYCFESVDLYVAPDTRGTFVEDCEICCRPWQISAWRGDGGELEVTVDRAQ